MRIAKRIECSGCGRWLQICELDLVLQQDGSERVRYFHERCIAAVQWLVLSTPDLWFLTHCHVTSEAKKGGQIAMGLSEKGGVA